MDLEELKARLSETPSVAATGRVRAVRGLAVMAELPNARLGDTVRILRRGSALPAEIVGFDGGQVVLLPLGELKGVSPDDLVESTGGPLSVSVDESLVGRVVDALGRPLDGDWTPRRAAALPLDREPPPALTRPAIREVMPTGVRAIDGLMTLGVGQRIGLFAGSGVGKSLLLGAIARGARADVVVVALVGERGREVREFLEHALGEQGRKRAVVVVATSDAPALERLKAAQTATSIAEYFRDQGQRVLLLVDSITRFARAQREVGLAVGEPPTRRAYPPSVFSMLPRLLERSGQAPQGSITGIYTVLVEGGDMDEPIADEVRGVLDGHIILDRAVAARGRYPAIDVSASLSRVMSRITEPAQQEAAARLREWVSAFDAKRDLIALDAYAEGSDPVVDRARDRMPAIESFLRQPSELSVAFEDSVAELLRVTGQQRAP